MTYKNDIGYSNVRIPNEDADLLYTYSRINTFPEEVFIHEFLHNLERIENEYGNNVPELHAYEKYGYEKDDIDGLRNWYKDYMTCNINNNKLGLSKEVYTIKPIHDSCFRMSMDLTEEKFYEPDNFVEQVKSLIEKIKQYFMTEGNDNGSKRILL